MVIPSMASSFSPYLTNTIIEGSADFSIEDFAFLNFQWFDEDLVALSKKSRFTNFLEVLEAIRASPKTVRACVVRGSGGHLITKLILETMGIPAENLNLVTYNSGGQARAAVAGGIVDFIVISAKGSESIREYLNPQAIISDQANANWGVPTLNDMLSSIGYEVPMIPGSIRGFATSSSFKQNHPVRFNTLVSTFKRALDNPALQALLKKMILVTGGWVRSVQR